MDTLHNPVFASAVWAGQFSLLTNSVSELTGIQQTAMNQITEDLFLKSSIRQ